MPVVLGKRNVGPLGREHLASSSISWLSRLGTVVSGTRRIERSMRAPVSLARAWRRGRTAPASLLRAKRSLFSVSKKARKALKSREAATKNALVAAVSSVWERRERSPPFESAIRAMLSRSRSRNHLAAAIGARPRPSRRLTRRLVSATRRPVTASIVTMRFAFGLVSAMLVRVRARRRIMRVTRWSRSLSFALMRPSSAKQHGQAELTSLSLALVRLIHRIVSLSLACVRWQSALKSVSLRVVNRLDGTSGTRLRARASPSRAPNPMARSRGSSARARASSSRG